MDFSTLNVTWYDIFGLIGVIVYISSYFSLQAGIVKGEGYLYASLNTVAATCVLLSLVNNFNLSSTIIQVTYIAISIFGMTRFYLLSHKIEFNSEERAFLSIAAPNLQKLHARKLLDLGNWQTTEVEFPLTNEGETITHLHFLLDGEAAVSVSGKRIANLDACSLVGEISYLSKMPASASVTLTKPSRLFSIDTAILDKFLIRNQQVRSELEASIANQISGKLIRANKTLLAQVEGTTGN